ncbi:MAG: neprosin family prolyl endopeptidase [Bryobacteraceae bacterium]
MASKNPQGIQPFAEFVASLESAKHEHFASRAAVKVANEDAFAGMRKHLIHFYTGVEAQNSFIDENGSIFDCIPTEQQPSLKGKSETVPKAPDLPRSEEKSGSRDKRQTALVQSLLHPARKDPHGNAMHCPEGTIPMRRITLENLARFETLQQFFKKSPVGSGHPNAASPAVAATHKYAHAYQFVKNWGGHSFLNLWDPSIGADQIFSLSQHWYVGGSGAALQTAEVGWQVYPQMYNNTKPVFFIYWTADAYQHTGCYNLTCTAFVQTSSSWTIGGAINPPWSTSGGAQYELQVAYFLSGGKWWLYINGTSGSNAIGYYPVSLYNGGAMATGASEIDYGGEVVGTTSWPPMGSGAFANAGYGKACYQRQIQYYPVGGGIVDASLTGSQPSPKCYTVEVHKFNPPWSETIFFGGPGGTGC